MHHFLHTKKETCFLKISRKQYCILFKFKQSLNSERYKIMWRIVQKCSFTVNLYKRVMEHLKELGFQFIAMIQPHEMCVETGIYGLEEVLLAGY